MGTCLREVGILAFLKIKREEAGFARDRAGFAELASWFYRRSAIGGVDHVCLVFRGGGISLREPMEHRTPTVSSVNGVASKPQTSVWQPHEVVAVARGLLEGIAFVHSAGLIHADMKPENVVLYPPSLPLPYSTATSDSAGTSALPVTPTTVNHRPGSASHDPQSTETATAAAANAFHHTQSPRGNTATTTTTTTASTSTMSQPRPPAPPFDLRLIDFGNAVYTAETMPGETAGTPSYLAPEARGGRAWGPAVDVWAVGCILYEIVAGCRVGENNVDCR
ncbi:unnamed protein product, partial [Sphacelaria rigidula]